MSDLKSLMRAKKQEARLNHPQAHYTAQGQLQCLTCRVAIKQSALFAPHLISKGHRVAVQKAAAAEASSSSSKGKRKREGDDGAGSKRAREEDGSDDEMDAPPADPNALPADFFADPSQAPAPAAPEPEPEPEPEAQSAPDDPEWAAFEASLAAGPSAGRPPSLSTASATIFAAPVQYEFGAPKVAEEGDVQEEEEEEQEETEEAKRERLELEEREEIMGRILEEEREQMEADEKVAALKRRLEAVRAARQKKKAA